MRPVRLKYLSGECHDTIVEHFFQSCPVALCQEDADIFFAVLCKIIDREIERVVAEAAASERGRRGPRS
jgi:hypothetical protein